MRPKTEDRRPKTEDRRPKTEDRRPLAVCRAGYFITGFLVGLSFLLPASYGFTEVSQDWTLDSDFSGSLQITGVKCTQYPAINLNGHKLTLDPQGIVINETTTPVIYGGTLTSNHTEVIFKFHGDPLIQGSYPEIDAVIADNHQSVGLTIFGPGNGAVQLTGNQSNTFTGNVRITGSHVGLVLRKSNGAIAVRSDLYVEDQALLRFAQSNQIIKTSKVTLAKNGRLQVLDIFGGNISNTFRSLSIVDNGILDFNHREGSSQNSEYHIYLEDLIIGEGRHLEIQDWQDGRDFLLVKKTSMHLADALKSINFSGYDPNNIHLEDFNSEYWAISAAPEPATYSVILGAVGIGLWGWRRKRRRAANETSVK